MTLILKFEVPTQVQILLRYLYNSNAPDILIAYGQSHCSSIIISLQHRSASNNLISYLHAGCKIYSNSQTKGQLGMPNTKILVWVPRRITTEGRHNIVG